MDDWIRSWQGSDAPALLHDLNRTFSSASVERRADALQRVAGGEPSPSSARAAEALCLLAGLGDPCDTADRLYNESDARVTEAQWFLWIAGYSYSWICNSGLSACYFEFDDRQFADRVRVYEAIGASQAAQVIRMADQAFGPDGPAPSLEGRQAQICDDLDAELDRLNQRFWDCGDEILTRAYLYALQHSDDFGPEAAARAHRKP